MYLICGFLSPRPFCDEQSELLEARLRSQLLNLGLLNMLRSFNIAIEVQDGSNHSYSILLRKSPCKARVNEKSTLGVASLTIPAAMGPKQRTRDLLKRDWGPSCVVGGLLVDRRRHAMEVLQWIQIMATLQ